MKKNKEESADFFATQTTKMLLEVDAVHFRVEPYIFTSGLASPVYIDCRKLISYPRVRSALMDFGVQTITASAGYEQFDCVAGGETAGIPFAALISERMGLPMVYVRKKPKGFGRNALIEGDMPESSRVLLVEDLTTDGGSKVNFANAIKEAGGEAAHAFSIFYYDIFDSTKKVLRREGITLHYLATWRDVLKESKKTKRFDKKTLKEVESFLDDPLKWSAKHGGIKTKRG